MGRTFGYARVSTEAQDLEGQVAALRAAGVDKDRIYVDKVSGTKASRPQWDKLREEVEDGDVIVTYRLDRFGRSLEHLIRVVNELNEKGVGLKTLDGQKIDTTTANGKLMFGLFGLLAEFERDVIAERTRVGLEAARAQGRTGGRPKSISENLRRRIVADARDGVSATKVAKDYGVSRATVYRLVKEDDEKKAATK